jgi:predicted amidohydrolase
MFIGLPPEDATRMASETPADILGLVGKGRIAPRIDADLGVLSTLALFFTDLQVKLKTAETAKPPLLRFPARIPKNGGASRQCLEGCIFGFSTASRAFIVYRQG